MGILPINLMCESIKNQYSSILVDLKIKDDLINILTQDKVDLGEEVGSNISEINEWKLDNKEKNVTILELRKKLESREIQIKNQEKELRERDLLIANKDNDIKTLKENIITMDKKLTESNESREKLVTDTDTVINFQKKQLQEKAKSAKKLEEALRTSKLNSDREMESLRIVKEQEVLKVRGEVIEAGLKHKEAEAELETSWTSITTLEDDLDKSNQDYTRLQKTTRQIAGENSINKSTIKFLTNSACLSTESSKSLLEFNNQNRMQIEEIRDKMTDSLKKFNQTNKDSCEIVVGQIENSELASGVSKSLSLATNNEEKTLTLAEKYELGAELTKNQVKRLKKQNKKKGMDKVKNPGIQGVKRKADFDPEEGAKSKRDAKKRNI